MSLKVVMWNREWGMGKGNGRPYLISRWKIKVEFFISVFLIQNTFIKNRFKVTSEN